MKRLLHHCIILTLSVIVGWGTLSAQTHVINGVVKDEQGKAVPFVTIQVKGTTIGTVTDTAGKFTLEVDSSAKALVLSYPSMKTQEVPIVSTYMEITMKADALGLTEVVITAIGIPLQKEALGYSTQVVGSDQLNTTGTGNVLSELNTKVAGLTVINSGGDPGAGTYINLRGVTSLTGNNQPLIIVDGVPLDNSINNYDPTDEGILASGANGNLTGGVQPTNRGLDLNPSDIASITVLKGPAATALYGIQAASGALIITTKKGSQVKEGIGVEFNSSLSFSRVNKLPKRQDQWGQGSNDVYAGPTGSGTKVFSWGPPIDSLYWDGVATPYDPHGSIVMAGDPNAKIPVTPYDPYDFFQTGVTSDNNIAFSGGNSKSGYRISMGNLHQTGVIPLSKYNKTTFSVNGQSALTKRLSISGGITYINSASDKVQQGSNISGVMLGLLRTPPTFDNANGAKNPATDSVSYELPDGTQRDYRGGPGYDNPYWTVNRNPFHEELNRAFGYGQVDYHLFDWMHITYRIGDDMYLQDDKNAYDIYSNAFYPSGLVILTDYFNSQVNSDFIVNMNHNFGQNFKGNLILGQNFFDQVNRLRFSEGYNLIVPGFFDMSNATTFLASEAEGGKRTSAWYGEAQLGYKSMLFLTVTGRDEMSSTLPANHDNFFYPSADLGWVFTEPLKLTTNKIFPYGKLRISWAQVGKDAPEQGLLTYYRSASILDGFTSGITFPFNGLGGYQISNINSVIGNPNLVPEKTNALEFGGDFAFLEDRIGLSITYYSEKTTNEIFTVPFAYSTGFASALLNAGEITNKGWEVSLNATPLKLKNGFRWDIDVNWSTYKSEVVSLAPGVNQLFIAGFTDGGIYALPGQPFGEIYGTDYIKTSDGKDVIDDNPNDPGYGMPIPGSKSVPLGSIIPKWIGGVNNTFSFKGINLGVELSVRDGGKIWDGTRGAMAYFGTAAETDNRGQSVTFGGDLGHLDANGNIVHYDGSGIYTPAHELAGPGTANNVQTQYNQYYWQNIGSSFGGPTSIDVVDGSFVRIGQISLGYNLPKKWVGKAHFTFVTITFFANNPFLWTKYPGVDPETSLAGPANGQGLDYFNNPGTKSYGIRLNVGL